MEMMSQTNNHLRRPRNKRSQTLSFSRRVPRRLNNSLQSSFHPLQTPHVLLLSQHRRSPSPRSLLSTNYFAAPECLSEQMCALSPTERAERDSVIRITSNALDTLRFGTTLLTGHSPISSFTRHRATSTLSLASWQAQFHSGEFLVARYNCAPSLARFVSALHAPHVPPHDTNNTSLSEQENEKKEKCSNKQKDGKKGAGSNETGSIENSQEGQANYTKAPHCLKPTDRDQVDPEVQVRNCSFVACTSVEMFLVGLCLPLDPSSAHFDSVGGRSEEERHHGVWHNIHDAKTAKVLRSLLEVDKDTVEGSFDFTIFGVPLVSFNSFSVSGHALLAITTEQPTSSVSVNFEDITQTIAGKARCVHVTSSSLGTVVTPSHWAGSFTQSQPLFDFVGCDSSLTSGHPFFGLSQLFYLLPVLGSRLGTRSFTQHRAFRVEYNICFFFRIRKWSKKSSPTLRVELTDTDTLCFTTIRIESCSLTGAPLLSLVLSATQHTNWDLNLKGISFAEESSNSVLSGALIFISGTSFATQLALSLPATSSLTITSCSFTSFTSSTSPSILSSTIQPIQSVTLSDTSFVSCHSSVSARSGVLDVSLIEGITITFTHSCETFTSCSSPKATANLIFISHPSLSVSVISSSLDLDSTKTSDSLADLAVKE
ncbi:hypothetical protein BLNAU_11002 [Blattamonas nauphoetae]|uniref:Uncharacterized protein n=1 Tax=Blattamonas nauphoetae TaxID=2049346 RepID=A0ABQ9XSC1_9EUKA|nr:hypothetical protein BLNAU_11002 [Blattamonas nauphoetae]